MEDIEFWAQGIKVIFTPSNEELPERLRNVTPYEVYVKGEYMGLAGYTGGEVESASKRDWRALKSDPYEVGEELTAEELAGTFIRWYEGYGGGSADES